ncbi:S41 family peptidase [Candidatus Omnitrophota bacterium]
MRRKLIIFCVLLILVALVVFATRAISAMEKKNKDDLFRQVSLFSDTIAIIQSEYVEDVPSQDLIYGALKGLLSALDPHSQFLDPDSYKELKVETEGRFGGLGIEITIKDGLLTIITPIEDTPAWDVGLKAGDRIVKIEDELTRDMTLIDAVKRLRGKPGDAVNITVLRESEKKLLDFKIVRAIIKIKDIKDAKILEDGIAYIRLVEFRENSARDINRALGALKKEGMDSLILDLRNNPGGLLDVAAKVAGGFIEKDKMIVYTKGRRGNQDLKFFSREDSPLLELPMVVLINEGSASGSEIVAACLQDHKRAIILGIKSFGKGSVQTVIPLGDGSALRLTTSKYFTPLGKEIHEKGVQPDIVVEQPPAPSHAVDEEKDAPGKIFDQLEVEKEEETGLDEKVRGDHQLVRAIDVIKALKIYRKTNSR